MSTSRGLAVALAVIVVAGCSGGGGHSSPAPAANSGRAVLEAARACRMWQETRDKATATSKAPDYAALAAMAGAIAPVATQASSDDPRWNLLALDTAAGVDFHSAALADIVARINTDCKGVPASAVATVGKEADPYSTTTVLTTTAPTTTVPTTTVPTTSPPTTG